MPTTCCRCNGSGRCRNCSCVNAQQGCTNCLPKRKGTCENSRVANGAHQLELVTSSSTSHTPPPSQPPALAHLRSVVISNSSYSPSVTTDQLYHPTSNSPSCLPNSPTSLAGQTYLLRWAARAEGKIRLVYLAHFP